MTDDRQPTEKASSVFWLAGGLVFFLGAFLRLFRVGDQLILDDEWHALNVVQDHDYGWIFSHLGHADHSIPLALLYEYLSHSIGLSELSMRVPSLLAGLVAIIVLPRLMRHWLKPRETLVMAALITISPFLVNYSRIARPYMLLALLAGAAVIFAWHWWQYRRENSSFCLYGPAWATCTVLAAWFNPVSLAVTCAPFLWFGVDALHGAFVNRAYQALGRLTLTGLSIVAGLAVLFYAPLTSDFASLAVKSGVHWINAQTVLEAAGLFSGSGHLLVVAMVVAAAATGWSALRLRDRAFAYYLTLITLASTIAVALTGAEWMSYGLVLARYLIGLLPLFLALVAIGLVRVCNRVTKTARLPEALASIPLPIVLLMLFLAGPLPHEQAGQSQFVHHMSNQFDFNEDRNPIRTALELVVPEPFYAEIALLHPNGKAVIVEAPWYLESNWNALPLYQAVHHQRVIAGFVGGTCAGRLYGELRQDIEGLYFRNFASLSQVLNGEVRADYLVLRKDHPPGAREIPMDFEQCASAARQVLGEPWRDTATALVFRLSDAS